MTPRFRWRPAEAIFNEMKHQMRRYQSKCFFECSPAINSNTKELVKLCDLILKDPSLSDIQWEGLAIIHSGMTPDVLQKMRRAGCVALSYGLESGSQKVLDLMDKRFQVADAERTLRDSKNAGIRVYAGFLVGYPGETEADFQESMHFLERNVASFTHVGAVSAMGLQPYSKILSEDLEGRGIQVTHDCRQWYYKDMSNTPEIRADRQKRLTQLAIQLGVHSKTI
jgi:radical SAM superfamily enzyme YgiQ (UPF0313 family)